MKIEEKIRQPKAIFLQYEDGSMVNIQDLPREEYEIFINSMEKLAVAYKVLVMSRDVTSNKQ
jgi:hypothetical protein